MARKHNGRLSGDTGASRPGTAPPAGLPSPAELDACTCQRGQCTRSEFADHQGPGVSPGCMACADLDPGQPCLSAEPAEACAKCHSAPRKPGRTSQGPWQYCERCLDMCHEALEFDHCCMICATPEEARALGCRLPQDEPAGHAPRQHLYGIGERCWCQDTHTPAAGDLRPCTARNTAALRCTLTRHADGDHRDRHGRTWPQEPPAGVPASRDELAGSLLNAARWADDVITGARQLVDEFDSGETIDLLMWAASARSVLAEVSRG